MYHKLETNKQENRSMLEGFLYRRVEVGRGFCQKVGREYEEIKGILTSTR